LKGYLQNGCHRETAKERETVFLKEKKLPIELIPERVKRWGVKKTQGNGPQSYYSGKKGGKLLSD